jgi:hypothetical protein
LRSNNYRVTASLVSPSKSNRLVRDYQQMFKHQQTEQSHVFKLMLWIQHQMTEYLLQCH